MFADQQEQGFLHIDGKRLEYRTVRGGMPGRPLLVLLHEGLGGVAMWKDFPEALVAATGCDVFLYSRAGYGRSDPVDLPRPLSYMHHEGLTVLPQLLDILDEHRVVLLGHSDGASIAIIGTGSTPDPRVRALILMAPHVFTEQVCIDSIRQARGAWQHGDLRERLGRYHGNVDVAFLGWNGAWLDPGFLNWNIEEYLSAIKLPILILQGEDDEYGTFEQVERIRDQVRGPVVFRPLPACGHSPHKDQPEMTLQAIADFLQQYFPAL